MRIECAPGSHTITFAYKEEENVIASKSLVITVISGRETAISGKIDKNETSTGISAPTSETKPIEVKQNEATTVSVNVAPANTSSISNQTTVTFPAGSFNDDSSNAVLNLSVKSADTNFSVTGTPITGTSALVAGIDISLLVNDQPVTSFNGQNVTINTFIATGLTGVKVYYDGQPLNSNDYSYDIASGKLTIKTNHFSEFYVGTNCEAVNVTTNKGYATLQAAINDVTSGDTVVLIKDLNLVSTIDVERKKLTLNLNGKTLSTSNDVPRFFYFKDNSDVIINGNGTLSGLTGSNAAAKNEYSLIKVENSILTIENGTFSAGGDNGNGLYGIFVAEGGNLILGTTDNGPTITTYFAAVSSNNTTSPAKIVVNSGNYTCTSSENKDGNSANRDWECAAFYLPASGNYEFNGGTVEGSKYAISTPYKTVTQKIEITGGTYSGSVSAILKDYMIGSDNTAPDKRVISITGGTFSSDPSDYVALGYNAELDSGKYVVSSTSDIIIKSANQLMQFAASVNAGNDYAGETIALGNDIDLAGITWIPIGNAENPFKGTFDGDNHKISNLTITSTSDCVGLFGFIDGGIVENIEIQSVSITNTSDDTGAAVGRIINGGKVSYVNVLSGSITGNKRTGGVVGTIKAYGTIENCTNAASVTSNTYNAGGIVGAAYYTESGKEMYITSCTNTESVTSNGNCAGGIVGLSAANVTGCTNRAKITGSGTSIGGIVGEQKTYGSVTNNTNTGSVENTNNGNYGNGGIIGWLRYHGTGEAKSYAVSAIISVTGNKNSGTVSEGNDAGGIVGTVYNSAVVTGNENTSNSLSGTTFAAGIVGNYQTTETPAASEPKSNKLTFAGNTNNTSFDNIEATNKNSLIYTNGNPIITPLAYMDNFSFCEIDSNGTQVGVPVYTTDFSNDVAENFCPYSGHGGANSNSNTHDNFVDSFVVSNGVAEIYRNSAWKHFDDIESSKTYEIRYDLKINELYNRKTSDGLDKALGFDFGERNHWGSRRLLFAKDGNELKVYLNSFDDTNARTIQAGKVYTITITFSQSIINDEENQKNRLTVNVKVIDPETKSVAFGPVEFTSIGDSPFNSYYWDIYYSIN